MLAFQQQGHQVLFLTQLEGNSIIEFLTSKGVRAFSYQIPGKKSLAYFLRHILYLIRFCRKNKVDIVYSHLEPANFTASVAQFFIKARVFLCRHHIDEAYLYRFDKKIDYRIT